MKSLLPKLVTKYFWGDDITELSWSKHALIAGQDLKIPLMNFTIYPNKDWCI